MSAFYPLFRALLRPTKIWSAITDRVLFWRFKRKYKFISSSIENNSSNPSILIVSLTDWVPRVQMEGILALALAQKNHTPFILTRRACKRAQQYFRVFGITNFIYFDDAMDQSADENDNVILDELLCSNLSFEFLLRYKYNNISIGANALSTVLRRIRCGSIHFDDPHVISMLKTVLQQSLLSVRAANNVLQGLRPSAVIFNEAGYTPYGEIFGSAVYMGLNVIQHNHGQRSDALAFKRYHKSNIGTEVFSLSDDSWQKILQEDWDESKEKSFMQDLVSHYEHGTWFNLFASLNKKHISVEKLRTEMNIDPQKPIAVLYSHVTWDASFFYGNNLFDDYEKWLVETVRVAANNKEVNWILKLHPDYIWHMRDLGERKGFRDLIALQSNMGELPEHIRIVPPDTDISTYSFFRLQDYCVTVRGTVGMESPCFGARIFTAGTGRYSGKGFTNDFATKDEYLHAIANIHTYGRLSNKEQTLARRHAQALFCRRLLPFSSFEMVPIRHGAHVIDHKTLIHIQSVMDIKKSKDLHQFASWALESKEDDYLEQS